MRVQNSPVLLKTRRLIRLNLSRSMVLLKQLPRTSPLILPFLSLMILVLKLLRIRLVLKLLVLIFLLKESMFLFSMVEPHLTIDWYNNNGEINFSPLFFFGQNLLIDISKILLYNVDNKSLSLELIT